MAYEETLRGIDRYIEALFAGENESIKTARETIDRKKMPSIYVSACEGKILYLLARMVNARRILEIGTLGAYSTIWLAHALPADGKMITLEINPDYAKTARSTLKRANLSGKVEVIEGPATESMKQLRIAGNEPFDVIFIDAEKEGYPEYLDLALPMLRTGGLILADNTLPYSLPDGNSESVITRFNQKAAASPELISTVLPVIRDGGIDGLLVSIKCADREE